MTAEFDPTMSPAAGDAEKAPTPKAKRARGEFLFFALRSKKFVVSVSILLFLILLAIFGPMIDTNAMIHFSTTR